jgi:hypothetical protein
MSPERVPDLDSALDEIESDPVLWLSAVLPSYFYAPPAPHHLEFWRWVDGIRRYQRPRPYVAVWSRSGGKTSNAQAAVVKLGARGQRRYAVVISRTQDQANDRVDGIASMLESPEVAAWYPYMSERLVGKYGRSRGWSRTRLRTASGFTVDALGLDSAARGAKVDESRPDLVLADDLDDSLDTPTAVARLEKLISRKILPAGSGDAAVLAIQNLIHDNGVFARLVDGRADYLADRIVSGPVPAVEGLQTVRTDGRDRIVGGEATWAGFDLETAQAKIDLWGLSAFLTEAQHDTEPPPGGTFSHLDFESIHVARADIPPLVRVVVWCDPAVTNTSQSDAHGVQVDGLGTDGRLYRLFSWEQRATPVTALTVAITHAVEYGAPYVGVETDQGGDTWLSVVREAKADIAGRLVAEGQPSLAAEVENLGVRERKAGSTQESKQARAQRHLLPHYERDRVRHVLGTHTVLERALRRFPLMKPLDLVDAAVWSARDLLETGQGGSSAGLYGEAGGWRRA